MNIYIFVHRGIHPFVGNLVKHLTFEYKELIPKFSHVSFYEVYILFSYFIQYVFYLYALFIMEEEEQEKEALMGIIQRLTKLILISTKEYHPI